MKLKVLGSGSSGNCYIMQSADEVLIIEAGMPFKDVKVALNFDVKKIAGVVISHSHGDHAKYVMDYVKAGIPVFKPYEQLIMTECCKKNKQFREFKVLAFPNKSKDGHWFHGNSDGSECPCYGFLIHHPDMGNLVYVTDTECVRWRFKDINHMLVEANYSDNLIEHVAINREHVLRGHLGLQTALTFISTNDNLALKNVVLIHLSDKNANSADFLQKAKETIKYGTDCYIAERGLCINLDLVPF